MKKGKENKMTVEEASYSVLTLLSLTVLMWFMGTVLVSIFRACRRFMAYQRIIGHPASKFSPIYGNLHLSYQDGHKRFKQELKEISDFKYRFHRFWLGPVTPIISTYHPDIIKKVLQSSAPKSRGFGSAYVLAIPWIGEGLISTNGGRWTRSRRLLTPAFHFDILKDYIQVYNEAAEGLCKKLDKFSQTGESVDITPMVTLATLETILKCALGYEADVQSGHPYAIAVCQLTQAWVERVRSPWLWPDWIFRLTSKGKQFYKNCDYVHRIAEDIIDKRIKTLNSGDTSRQKRRLDFIDILLTAKDEDDKTMTNLEIRNEVNTFTFAGHDTSSSAISWCLSALAQNPEYQEKIQEEIDIILKGRDCEDILWEDLTELKTLSLCIKESMRLYTIVPFLQRQLDEEIELDGHIIPAGTIVNVAIHVLHRNPVVWDAPDEFRPERFLSENRKNIDACSYIPFSYGSRNCIGQNFALNEMKVILATILRRYTLEPATDHPRPAENASVVLRSDTGIWLHIKKR